MAIYYNSIPSKFLRGDVAQFRPGSYRLTIPAGQYRVEVAGGRGGHIAEKAYSGGGGFVVDQEVKVTSASTCSISVGDVGIAGGVTYSQVSSGSVMWQYVDYTTSWYDSATGRYKIPLGSTSTKETVHAGGDGEQSSLSIGGQYIVGRAGQGAQQNRSGVGGGNNAAGYVKITALRSAPATPTNVTLAEPYSGQLVEMACQAISSSDEIMYVWEGRADTNAFMTIGKTKLPSHKATVPMEGTTYQVRVKAVDDSGAESATATSPIRTIIKNYPPIISGQDINYGKKANSFQYSFSVDDQNEKDDIIITVLLDGKQIEEIEKAERKKIYTIDLETHWKSLQLNEHKLKIIAKDSEGTSAERIISFTRTTPGIHLQLAEPIQTKTGTSIRTAQALFFYEVPEGTEVKIWLTNNACATNPTWHAYEKYERGHIFEFPTIASREEEGFSAQIKIIKAENIEEEITFSGAIFMINANGNESEKWADNILFSNSFTGALSGITSLGEMAQSLDLGLIGNGSTGTLKNDQNGSYMRLGDLQICFHKIKLQKKLTSIRDFIIIFDEATASKIEIMTLDNIIGEWNFPVQFSDIPHISYAMENKNQEGANYINVLALGYWK